MMSPIARKKQPGITLLIALLILSTIMAVSFSLATILLSEARNSGDLLRSEPSLYADNGISEEAIFNVSRATGITNYSSAVGSLPVTTVQNPLNDPVQKVKVPSTNTSFGCGANCYALYNPANPYGAGGYGRIQVKFLNTGSVGTLLHIYLCQWNPDPNFAPKDTNTGTYANICSQASPPPNIVPNYMKYQDTAPLSPDQTWDTGGPSPSCAGCMDASGNSQQELILYQTTTGQPSDIYAQISTFDSAGNPMGIPYFGQTSVTISSNNAGVSRDIKVIVPNAGASTGGAASGNSAVFTKTDAVTQGNWQGGGYGTAGYNIITSGADPGSYPAYLTVTPSGQTYFDWSDNSALPQALLPFGGGTRFLHTWYTNGSEAFDFKFTDSNYHSLALYLLDFGGGSRTETLTVTDGDTGTTLNTQNVSNFTNGIYYVWKVSGHIKIQITNTGNPNAVMSGIFIQ